MAKKFLDGAGLATLWARIKSNFVSDITYTADTGDNNKKKLFKTKNGSTTALVTAETIVTDGGAYKLPSSGKIPRTDLETATQTALGKADKIYITNFTISEITGDSIDPGAHSKISAFETAVLGWTSDYIILIPADNSFVVATIVYKTTQTIIFNFMLKLIII